jgi:glucose-1-phosphate adenylyltransferase
MDRLAAELGDEGADGEDDLGDGARLKDFRRPAAAHARARRAARAYAHDGYWRDVGTVDSYWEGHMDLLDAACPLRPDDPAWPVLTAARPRLPARILGSARVDDSLVCAGCTVAGDVARSVLGPGVVVEQGAVVRDSVLLGDVTVRRGARVAFAIVDGEVEVGRGRRGGRRRSRRARGAPADHRGGASGAGGRGRAGERRRCRGRGRRAAGARLRGGTLER